MCFTWAYTDIATESIQRIMEKAMEQFGDQLYIKHTPILQQEGTNSYIILRK